MENNNDGTIMSGDIVATRVWSWSFGSTGGGPDHACGTRSETSGGFALFCIISYSVVTDSIIPNYSDVSKVIRVDDACGVLVELNSRFLMVELNYISYGGDMISTSNEYVLGCM
jgi:hypothetical protein